MDTRLNGAPESNRCKPHSAEFQTSAGKVQITRAYHTAPVMLQTYGSESADAHK
jgi:hypothetical protein